VSKQNPSDDVGPVINIILMLLIQGGGSAILAMTFFSWPGLIWPGLEHGGFWIWSAVGTIFVFVAMTIDGRRRDALTGDVDEDLGCDCADCVRRRGDDGPAHLWARPQS
jgi:hypothetical protein